MADNSSIFVYVVCFGYLAALIFAFARWRGFQYAIKKNAKLLLVTAVVAVLFLAFGGGEILFVGLAFALPVAVLVGMIAGPFGFVLGLFLGFGAGVLVALSPFFTLP